MKDFILKKCRKKKVKCQKNKKCKENVTDSVAFFIYQNAKKNYDKNRRIVPKMRKKLACEVRKTNYRSEEK